MKYELIKFTGRKNWKAKNHDGDQKSERVPTSYYFTKGEQ